MYEQAPLTSLLSHSPSDQHFLRRSTTPATRPFFLRLQFGCVCVHVFGYFECTLCRYCNVSAAEWGFGHADIYPRLDVLAGAADCLCCLREPRRWARLASFTAARLHVVTLARCSLMYMGRWPCTPLWQKCMFTKQCMCIVRPFRYLPLLPCAGRCIYRPQFFLPVIAKRASPLQKSYLPIP